MKSAFVPLTAAAGLVALFQFTALATTPETRLVWARGAGDTIEVTGGSHGTRLQEGHRDLQRTSDRLNAIRTTVLHVRWRQMTWSDGRFEIEAYAESATYANLALLAVRDLWPGMRSAGSGIRQLRGARSRMGWQVLIRLTPPR